MIIGYGNAKWNNFVLVPYYCFDNVGNGCGDAIVRSSFAFDDGIGGIACFLIGVFGSFFAKAGIQ